MSFLRNASGGKYLLLCMCGVTALSIAVHPEGHGHGWEWMREQQRLKTSGQENLESLTSAARHSRKIEIQDPDRLPQSALYAGSMGDPLKEKS